MTAARKEWRTDPVALHVAEAFDAFADLLVALTRGALREARVAAYDMRGSGRDARRALAESDGGEQ